MSILIICVYLLLLVAVDASLQKVYPEVYQKHTQKYTKSVARAPTMHSFDSYSSLCIHISCYLCVVAAYCLLCEFCHYWLVSVNIHRHPYTVCLYLLVSVETCWYFVIFKDIYCYWLLFVIRFHLLQFLCICWYLFVSDDIQW